MLVKLEGNKWKKKTVVQIAAELLKPARAIELAAAWMAHLKQHIVINGRNIDDYEAAYAYCGCSGVVTVSKNGAIYYPTPSYKHLETWLKTGKLPNEANEVEANRRRRELDAMFDLNKGGDGVMWEFWRCVDAKLKCG